MCKLKITKLKLFVPAGEAAAVPPFGPILGQYGVNTVQFCSDFNASTENLVSFFSDNIDDEFGGFILSVTIFIYEDRTYKFEINKPPISFLLRLLTGVTTGNPASEVAQITTEDVVYLAQFKFTDLPLRSACRIISGSARSIGIRII